MIWCLVVKVSCYYLLLSMETKCVAAAGKG